MLDRNEAIEEVPLPSAGAPAPALDPIRVAWRWKWLIALGAALGSGLGYLSWTKEPTVYTASARLQVTMPLPIGVGEFQLDRVAKIAAGHNRTEEAMIIKSAAVLKEAIDDAQLSSFPELAGMDTMSMVRMMQGGLQVEPASKDLTATIINISFTSGNPKLSEAVVSGVISAYNSFLGAEYRKVGTEIVSQINKVREEMDNRFTRLSTEYATFRNEAPLYWIGGEGRDPFADNLAASVKEIGTLDLQLTRIKATIQAAEEALQSDRPLEGVFLMVTSEMAGSITNGPTPDKLPQSPASTRIDELRSSNIALQIQEESFLRTGFGENHPSIQKIRNEIRSNEILISKMEEANKLQLAQEKENQTTELSSDKLKVTSPREQIVAAINGLKEKLVALQIQRKEMDKFRLENETKSRELQGFVAKNQMFQDQIASSQEAITAVASTLDKLSVVPETGSRTMQELDRFGASPSRASMNRFLGLGAAVGGLAFGALGYLLSFADRRYKGPEDVIRELGRPIWGQIPLMDTKGLERKDSKLDPGIVVHHRSKSTTSESFRGVRTSLYFGNRSGDLKLVQVTSASPADGKSTLAANLAVSIAQSGRKVALVDCDFRRPRVDKIFGIENKVGLSTMLAGDAELPDICQSCEVPNLTLIPSGLRPSNPAELLSSEQFSQALSMLREKFDYVIIDSPPVLAVSDPAVIAARVDGTLIALRLRHNDRALSTRALKMLSSINANVLGVVVIGVTGNGSSYGRGYGYGSYGNYGEYGRGYGYGYGYGYGHYGKNPYKSYYDIPDASEKKVAKKVKS